MRQSQMERGGLSRRDAPVLLCFSTFSSSSPTPVHMATHKSSKAQWLNNGRKMRALVLGNIFKCFVSTSRAHRWFNPGAIIHLLRVVQRAQRVLP